MTIFEFQLFGITIAPSYYGLMYALGFIGGYFLVKKSGKISEKLLDDLFFYIFLGVILGGRIGYMFFYDFSHFLGNPLSIIEVWNGGMSFHGGVLGVILSMIIFSRKYKINFYLLADEITRVLPIGLGLGRIGNYLNKELLGFSPYNGFLAVEKNGVNYFPSPLLEAGLEGMVLFIILYFINLKKNFNGQIASLFLIFYGIFRIFVEVFFRMPDAHIGYIFGFLTLGEILSFPMIIVGIFFYIKLRKNTLK